MRESAQPLKSQHQNYSFPQPQTPSAKVDPSSSPNYSSVPLQNNPDFPQSNISGSSASNSNYRDFLKKASSMTSNPLNQGSNINNGSTTPFSKLSLLSKDEFRIKPIVAANINLNISTAKMMASCGGEEESFYGRFTDSKLLHDLDEDCRGRIEDIKNRYREGKRKNVMAKNGM